MSYLRILLLILTAVVVADVEETPTTGMMVVETRDDQVDCRPFECRFLGIKNMTCNGEEVIES